MIHHLHVVAVLILITDTLNTERTVGLKPPQDVKIVGSYLQWKPSKDDNVLYSLQYTYNPKYNAEDEWLNVSSHIGRKLRITPEFYGAVFRVRTEKGNNVSEWQYSNPVQCVNVETFCLPVTNLIVTPERVSLTMAHMDESLDKEYGEHIEFNISYWKVDNGGSPKVESIITNRKNEPFPELELEQNYCFQVEYLLYNKPYGNASKERCEFIPETPEAARRRVLLYSILTTFFVSAMCGICIFVLFKYHKKVKQLLQPVQLEIPDHYREVLYGRFPLQAFPSPSSQSLRSCDLITVIEEEEQEKRSLT